MEKQADGFHNRLGLDLTSTVDNGVIRVALRANMAETAYPPVN